MEFRFKINENKKIEMDVKDFQELIKYSMSECDKKDYSLFEKVFQMFLFQNKKLTTQPFYGTIETKKRRKKNEY